MFATAEAARSHAGLLAGLAGSAPVTVVGDRALASLADTVTPQGLVGVARTVVVDPADAVRAGARLVAVLVDVRDPGNAGTIVRVADAAGADAVLFARGPEGGSVDPHTGKCVRASAGSLFHLPVGAGPLEAVLAAVLAAGLRVVVADAGDPSAVDLDDLDDETLGRPSAWFFGNEAHGVPPDLRAAAHLVARVPIHGRAESLNVATAAAICLYAGARGQHRSGGREVGS